MACPCCGPPPCCKNGYPTITFTLSGGTTGNPLECEGRHVPDCGVMNGSYVFNGEDIFNGTANLSRTFTIRPSCYVTDIDGSQLFIPAIVATLSFRVTCSGNGPNFLGYVQLQAALGTEPYLGTSRGSSANWNVFWQNLQVDPEDGCVISANYGPASPTSYHPLPALWGDTCGGWPAPLGSYGPTTIVLTANVSR